MSEFPQDIEATAKQIARETFPFEGRLRKEISEAILAERKRGAEEQTKRLEAICFDLRRQMDALMHNWSSDLGGTSETKAAGAAAYIINSTVSSIEVEMMKLDKVTGRGGDAERAEFRKWMHGE